MTLVKAPSLKALFFIQADRSLMRLNRAEGSSALEIYRQIIAFELFRGCVFSAVDAKRDAVCTKDMKKRKDYYYAITTKTPAEDVQLSTTA